MKLRFAAFILLAWQLTNACEARKSDTLIGKLTKDDISTFATSFALGLTHGYINQKFENQHGGNNDGLHAITLLGAAMIEQTIHEEPIEKLAVLWGHGIGQCITESFSQQAGAGVRVGFRFNTALILALLKSIGRLEL